MNKFFRFAITALLLAITAIFFTIVGATLADNETVMECINHGIADLNNRVVECQVRREIK